MTKKIIIILLISIILLTGCTKENQKKESKEINIADYAGVYEGLYTRAVDDQTNTKKRETFSLVLNEDGTGVHNHNDSSYNIKWSYDGEVFQMTEEYYKDIIEYSGTLKKGKIIIYDGEKDKSFTTEYVYLKE